MQPSPTVSILLLTSLPRDGVEREVSSHGKVEGKADGTPATLAGLGLSQAHSTDQRQEEALPGQVPQGPAQAIWEPAHRGSSWTREETRFRETPPVRQGLHLCHLIEPGNRPWVHNQSPHIPVQGRTAASPRSQMFEARALYFSHCPQPPAIPRKPLTAEGCP